MKDVIAIFDIGKTNKKILLFDEQLNIVYQKEQIFPETKDDDGFACDDVDALEKWLFEIAERFVNDPNYRIKAFNFSTYGATIIHLDREGKRLTPVYNYLKPMPDGIVEPFYEAYGGEAEFSRKTASPALKMLNSGLQILWIEKKKPDVFQKIKNVLHLPQYVSYLFTKQICSEYTSIGCHTAMWDFGQMRYHPWLKDHNITLPEPIPNDTLFTAQVSGKEVPVGIGIHDSSASLVPYLKGSDKKFILLSTGTWSIHMNPFNKEPLTADQLKADCLCYLSVNQEQVKSSRLFMGHIHDVNIEMIANHFNAQVKQYRTFGAKESIIIELKKRFGNDYVFFKNGIPIEYQDTSVDLSQFKSYEEAYIQLMMDLVKLAVQSIELVLSKDDGTENIFISGGFARNQIFVKLLATQYPDKKVFTSEIDNATALGAAIMVWEAISSEKLPELNLGLKLWHPMTM
ncbi:carbohydrate kinase [bacterium]|nr:carbohydrate kinase [bacterium]RQV97747.1 MAG: carbohydrate kinase [bacterium]